MAKKTAKKSVLAYDLERIIAQLDTLYERGEECVHPDTGIVVTDGEYDALRRELAELKPDSEVFAAATASLAQSTVQKVVHDPPMTSIEKASHEDVATQEEMLFKWIANCTEATEEEYNCHIEGKSYKEEPVSYPENYFYQAYKLDGVALAIYYEEGKLARAGLRPRDGIHGEDVTAQVKYVSGVPKTLKQKKTCSIRGELICTLSDFGKVQEELAAAGEKLRANPRNHAAGGIRQFKDPTKTNMMRLSFIAYALEGLAKPPFRTELERAAYCRDKLGVPYIETQYFDFADLARMEDGVPNLDFEVDGVIIGVNSIEDQEQLGRHGDPRTGNPKGKIAWKFREEEAHPVIREIEWQTGRTGKIVAVAIFDPVQLAGTNVSRATLHNAGFMQRKQIALGTQIAVRKAGKIIPKVTDVVGDSAEPEFPSTCPSCGQDTELVAGAGEMLELVCNNGDCPAQNVSGLCHYLETFGILGLGESRVSSLVEGGKVKIAADFYRLTKEDCMACGLSDRQSTLALAAVQMVPAPDKLAGAALDKAIADAAESKKKIPLWQLFATFGIDSAGKSAGKALERHFGTLEKIRAASVEHLEEVDDIGTKTAEAISEYLEEHAEEIDALLEFVEPEKPKTGKLSGLTFCFSGSFEEGKRHWEQQVENQGAKTSSSVSKKTNYLVAGPGSGSKSEKADKLGVPILDVSGLRDLL
ncbi:MAG: NAD-dependent DNA ligase LigA [Planctomycetota bacterium]|nr:NAD-dependent DNA ligase LigA [Planctomycetota bacterium]